VVKFHLNVNTGGHEDVAIFNQYLALSRE